MDPLTLGLFAAGTLFKFASDESKGEQEAAAQKRAVLDQAQQQRDLAQTVRDEAGQVRETATPVLNDAEADMYNATIAEQNAAITRAAADDLETRVRVQGEKALGSIQVGYAASGLQASGSAQDVLQESAVNSELDALTVRYQGLLQARAYDQEAALGKWRAGNARRSAGVISGRADTILGQAKRQDLAALRLAATADPLARNIRSGATGNAVSSLLGSAADIVRRTA